MNTRSRHSDDLQVIAGIIDRVDQFTLKRFRATDLRVDTKPDFTPVTDADRGAEQIIRDLLAQFRSRDAVFGEEQGQKGFSNRRWIIDPIDGTKNFVRGVPVWATLVALEEDGEIVLGMVSAPALNRRWWAAKGLGAYTGKSWTSAKQIHVSQVNRIDDASLSYSSLDGWQDRGQLRGFLRLAQASWRTRAYGDFWSYMLVAEGAVDIATEPSLELYDMAALVPILTEAGGTFTDLDGNAGPWGKSALATNGLLHQEALDILQSVSDNN
ncbi:histidinol-phosphatase [Arcanobacterium pluranimalium]|uniref:histidinol-phosphatase n=1 Tax=Arcanobacterium pluranimalium TaxID=108028 RepID=UPI0019584331|nr:histidinol-phosphatase [Arcanobacterium pluranimalium]MBM7825873.1 histidinol-phosphatase [Arcanobacterium pluranimalium]